MSHRPQHHRGGYSLLEMLVYIAVLAVAINLFLTTLHTGSRLTATTTLQLSRMEGIREVQQSFVGYVRRAAAVVPGAGEFRTDANRVVLQMPPGQEEGFSHLVLGALRDPHRFSVMGLTESSGTWTEVYGKTLRQPLGQQQFEVDMTGGRTQVSLTCQVQQEAGERDRPFLVYRSTAAPRSIMGEGQ